MEIEKTGIEGVVIVKPKFFNDSRGFFFEGFNAQRYKDNGIVDDFVQDNFSLSQYGVIRGLHFQLAPFAQSKLVQVIRGKVLDVAVDIRQGSPTFGKFEAVVLSDENRWQFYIPRGFAHGFSVLSDEALFHYKCDNYYNPQAERGIKYNDPSLAIDWMVPADKAIVSSKDCILPFIGDAEMNFYTETQTTK
jgi:dTDP-4-dehydrorhamnose 3,5-epimerase